MMKRILILLTVAIVSATTALAEGWPSQYGGVMLQGFYWDGYVDSQWNRLEKQADNLATTFDLVWIPQSANCGGQSMGYDDLYWFSNYDSSFGTAAELKSMINTFKQKGIGTIADIVINHRKNASNWVDFPRETYKGVTYQLLSTDICADDDGGKAKTEAAKLGLSVSANNDTGEGWNGMRDLDHKSENVQQNVKAYLKMLLEDYGYAGFRYDMVKGYSGQYTKMYNEAAQPQFSVGECWDGSTTIRNWIDATGKTSAAFDFQFRYTVRNAANTGNWTQLGLQNDGNWPLVSSNFQAGAYRQYAVTFVENHDTEYRSASAPQDPLRKDTLAANAYLLAMPGTPCVFMKHWQAYKQEIANMAAVRKAVGITNVSAAVALASNVGYYAVQVAGDGDKKLLCVVGTQAASYTPAGSDWKKAISGYHYAYYVKGIEPSAIVLPQLKADEQQPDGKYSGVPSFCTVGEGEICAFFEAPATWGSQIFTWAWMTGKDGKDYLGTSWPGVAANYLGTAPNGNKVFKWTSGKTTAPNNIIFSGGGQQTADMPFANGGYYTKDGRQTVVTTGISRLAAGRLAAGTLRVATTDGRLLRQLPAGTTVEAALSGLPHGIYLVEGRKIAQ
jgi:alpha-amylase